MRKGNRGIQQICIENPKEELKQILNEVTIVLRLLLNLKMLFLIRKKLLL
jgi:hypothetical protein